MRAGAGAAAAQPGYFEELRQQWRPITGCFLGMSAGLSITPYILAVMGPALIAGLGWSRSELAAGSTLAILSTLTFPFAGRLCDIIGTRATAMIGVISFPLIFIGYSLMQDFATYMIVFLFQSLLTVTTTAVIYCRVLVQYVHRAKGMALALACTGPGVVGLLGGPILAGIVAAHGWRAGYVALAIFTAVAGAAALWLIPRNGPVDPDARIDAAADVPPGVPRRKRNFRRDFAVLRRMRAFWLILSAVLLANIPHAVMLPMLGLIMQENGVTGPALGLMVSVYAVGMLLGRVVSGAAIDRFPPHLVTFAGLALSTVGIFAIASPFDNLALLMVSVVLVGLSYGTESDIMAFLVARFFGTPVYSMVFGMSSAVTAVSCAIGTIVLSLTLKATGAYWPFLAGGGIVSLIGCSLFLFLPRHPVLPRFDGAPAAETDARAGLATV